MDQERVARMMHWHKYMAMPVVDGPSPAGSSGLITVDDIVDVIQDKGDGRRAEDVQHGKGG